VGVDGVLGDEQPRADLLVAQPVRDQVGDLGLALAQRYRRGTVLGCVLGLLAERERERVWGANTRPRGLSWVYLKVVPRSLARLERSLKQV
jgi:hypothetical protein